MWSRLFLPLVLVFALWGPSVSAAEVKPGGAGELLTLKTKDGLPFSVYRVGPRGAKHGVLLIHDSFGLDSRVRDWADWLAGNGYRVLVPDLFAGQTARTQAEADANAAALDQRLADAKHRAALSKLRAPGRKLASMGWGFGGQQALYAAIADPHAVSAVALYDVSMPERDRLQGLRVPVLAMFARSTETARVEAFQTLMKEAGKPVSINYYELEQQEPAAVHYSGEGARAVWRDTESFLKRYLK